MESRCLPVPWDAAWATDRGELRQYLASLYSQKKAHLFNIVFSLSRNASDAEEITQEAFLRLYVHLKNGREVSGDPMNWLVCVARNMAVDRARRARREETRQESDWQRIARDHCGHDLSPEECAILSSQEQEILRLIDTLGGLQRECLALRLRGVSFREIAEALNVSLSVAVDQTNRAIEKVKRRARK